MCSCRRKAALVALLQFDDILTRELLRCTAQRQGNKNWRRRCAARVGEFVELRVTALELVGAGEGKASPFVRPSGWSAAFFVACGGRERVDLRVTVPLLLAALSLSTSRTWSCCGCSFGGECAGTICAMPLIFSRAPAGPAFACCRFCRCARAWRPQGEP